MHEIIKNVIESGRFELVDMLKKIDTIWLQGDITEEQKTELVALAQEKANPENSYAPLQEQIEQAFEQIKALESRVAKLETGGEEPEPIEEYPAYVQPTGAHDAYYKDDKVTFEGKKYICIAPEGTPCVWSPKDYPTYWEEIKE